MSILPQPHPSWCDVDRCHAFDSSLGQHRSKPFDYFSPGLVITFTIFRAETAWHVETFLTCTISFDGDLKTIVPDASFTLAIGDADRLRRFMAQIVEVARGATG